MCANLCHRPRVGRWGRCFLALAVLLALSNVHAVPTTPFEGISDRSERIRIPTESDGVVLSEFEEGHGFLNWFPTGTATTDRDVRRFGDASLRLATDGDGSPVAAEYRLPHAIDLRSAFFRVWVRVDDPGALSGLRLQATGDDWKTFVSYPLQGRIVASDEGRWLRVAALATDREPGPAPQLVNTVRIRADDRGAAPVVVHVDRLSLVRKAASGMVSITFDDGWASQYHLALPIMERFGFLGTAFVVPYLVGTEHYMDPAMLDELYAAGWDVAGHYHPSLRGREDPELGHILRSVHQFLAEGGFARGSRLFAYPEGYFDQPVLVPAVARHFRAARTVVPGLETLPPADAMRLRSFGVRPDTTTEEIDEALSAAERDKAWLILVFHRITEAPAYATEVTPEAFADVLARIAASGLPVLPMTHVLEEGTPAGAGATGGAR